ncbi:hypothetical protein P7C70_g1485, partial [Phenoliferia sp. Uapishka_3]
MPKIRTERTRAALPSPHSRQASEQAKQGAFDALSSERLFTLAAARKFGVPAQSIGRWLKLGFIPDRHQSSLSLLTTEEEEQLCVYLERLSLAAHPLLHRQLRLAALQIIALKGKLAGSTDKTEYPTRLGKNWTYRFLLRHNTNLHIMKSQLLEAKRASMANPKQMSIWFKVWEESCKALGLDPRDEKTWHPIYNIVETGRRSGMHGGKKIISKKMSRPYVKGSGGRENISILSGICGDGTWVNPLIIFKGTRVLSKWWSDFGVDEWRPSFANIVFQVLVAKIAAKALNTKCCNRLHTAKKGMRSVEVSFLEGKDKKECVLFELRVSELEAKGVVKSSECFLKILRDYVRFLELDDIEFHGIVSGKLNSGNSAHNCEALLVNVSGSWAGSPGAIRLERDYMDFPTLDIFPEVFDMSQATAETLKNKIPASLSLITLGSIVACSAYAHGWTHPLAVGSQAGVRFDLNAVCYLGQEVKPTVPQAPIKAFDF